MTSYEDTARWLCSLKSHGSKFGIGRMARFAEALGHPEHTFPAIHIAGSNGKGSTAAMLEAIYRAAGLRTGLYTSPHLVRLGERVQVNRVPLSEDAICAYVEELRPAAAYVADEDPENAPTFFEFMTAMAFLEFKRQAVDIAIVETGLGGRLDATNILIPRLSVITSISLEHTEYLGDSIEKIAVEKGGIIKPGVPVVLGLLPQKAEDVLCNIAKERGSRVFALQHYFSAPPDESVCDPGEHFPPTNLAGQHQHANAGLAQLAVSQLGEAFPVSPETCRTALLTVDWPARWQSFALPDGRRLILDAAHNAEGAEAIGLMLAEYERERGRKPHLVVGALGVERARPLLGKLAQYAASLHLVRPEQERACDFEALAACVPSYFDGPVVRANISELFPAPGECAVGRATSTLPRRADVIVVGSVYLAGEVLARFLPGGLRAESELQDRLTTGASAAAG